MRITALIAASVAALALAAPASAASPALHDLSLDAGSNYVVTSVNDDLGLDNDRGRIDRHVIGADSTSVQLGSTDTAAGNHGHVLLN